MKFIQAKNQAEIFAVIYIRKRVFMDEQNVSVEEELDGRDFDADHYLVESNGKYIGTCRIYYENNEATIGRVAVLKEFRKKGGASIMMKNAIKEVAKKEVKTIHIGAQVQAVAFYEKFGFKVSGDLYLDANIEHYPMVLTLWKYHQSMKRKNLE